MGTPGTISVLIATLLRPDPRAGRSGRSWLESALRSVMAQEILLRGWRLEVLVGLDGKAPEPDDGLRRRVGAMTPPGVRVGWLRAARPGQAAASNALARAATGEMLAFLDDDDFWDPRWLAIAADFVGRFDLMSSSQNLVDLTGRRVAVFDFAVPSTWVMRRGLWDEVGGMDEGLWCHTDTDFLGRVNAAMGRRLHFVERGARAWRGPMLEEVARRSAIAETCDNAPLVTRSVNPGGITETIRRDGQAGRSSERAHEILLERYGHYPY